MTEPTSVSDRARLEMRPDGGADLGIGAERRADDHEVGAGDGRGRVGMDAVDEAELDRLGPRPLALGVAGDVAGELRAAASPGQRGADQADADERHARNKGNRPWSLASGAALQARAHRGEVGERRGHDLHLLGPCRW